MIRRDLLHAGAAVALLGAAGPLAAQQIRGVALSADGERPLEGVTVVAESERGRTGAKTGADGVFRLTSPGGPTRLIAARIGYAPDTLATAEAAGEVIFRLRPAPLALDEVVVRSERAYSAASTGVIRELDLRLRPRESSQELLSMVPGLVIAQHAGGGKAEQIFLRGFDADHGTDVAISVDGSPVNMVSHGHGQGYADLHFLMPEVVERVELRKGPYDVRDGDFATAGAVMFRTRDRLDAALVGARVGSFATGHGVALLPFGGDAAETGGYLAVAGSRSDGPFRQSQDFRRLNLFGKLTSPLSRNAELVASLSGFDSRWDASGQVPQRAVDSGLISRFGAIDGTEGGETSRYDAALGLRSRAGSRDRWEVRAYAARYDFQLFSNFTFLLNDPVNGDGIEQTDGRWLAGAHAGWERDNSLLGHTGRWTLGGGTRNDLADVTLAAQRERVRLGRRVDAGIAQSSLFGYAQQELELGGGVRAQLGVRGDLFRFAVSDRLPRTATAVLLGPGAAWRAIASPKLNLAWQATDRTALFANLGSGFHSNDSRDVLAAGPGDRVIPRALGSEVGARHSWGRGTVAAALWRLDLQSELVYVGDEGVTEANGPTRRAGVDLEGRLQIAPWLWADADLNLTRGRFRNLPPGEDRIPLAPTRTSTGGLTARDLGPAEGGLRFRHVAERPANEDGSVRALGYTVWELFASYQLRGARLYAALDNLLDVEWNEAQFDTESRLLGEPRGISELHFTPGAPRSVQVGVEVRW